MNARELLADLSQRGVVLKPSGDRLRVAAPPGSLSDEQRIELAEHKGELMKLLRNDEVAAMPLDEFAAAGLILTVYSAALDRRVLFVSDNVPEERIGSPELPVFRASEMKKLAALRPPPSSLRTLAEVKAVFRADGATIEEIYRED